MNQLMRTGLIASVLGLLPFVMFVGASNTTTINGEVVQESHLNILGLVLSAIGLAMAVRGLRSTPQAQRSAPGLALAVVAIVICIVQIGASAGLY